MYAINRAIKYEKLNQKYHLKGIKIIYRLFLVIAMYFQVSSSQFKPVQASSSQFNKSLNLPHCKLVGIIQKYMQ